MKIVNRSVFLSMPKNTVFQKYHPHCVSELEIKHESYKSIDYWSCSIVDSIGCDSSEEREMILESALETGVTFSADYNQSIRDACYDEDQLFIVYDNEDIDRLIIALKDCMK